MDINLVIDFLSEYLKIAIEENLITDIRREENSLILHFDDSSIFELSISKKEAKK